MPRGGPPSARPWGRRGWARRAIRGPILLRPPPMGRGSRNLDPRFRGSGPVGYGARHRVRSLRGIPRQKDSLSGTGLSGFDNYLFETEQPQGAPPTEPSAVSPSSTPISTGIGQIQTISSASRRPNPGLGRDVPSTRRATGDLAPGAALLDRLVVEQYLPVLSGLRLDEFEGALSVHGPPVSGALTVNDGHHKEPVVVGEITT